MRRRRLEGNGALAVIFAAALALGACDDVGPEPPDGGADADLPDGAIDAGDDADADTAPTTCIGYDPGSLAFHPSSTGLIAGAVRVLRVEVEAVTDCDLDIRLDAEDSGTITVPQGVVIAAGARHADVELRARAPGTTAIRASLELVTSEGAPPERFEAEASVEVAAAPALDCDSATSGVIGPGETLAVEGDGSALDGASLSLPPDDALPTLDLTIECADDLVPQGAGYLALGPAVTFRGDAMRFSRELGATLPFWPALAPARAGRHHFEVFYRGPGDGAARRVALSDRVVVGGPTRALLAVNTQRLGTFQVAVAEEAGSRTRTRRYVFRGLMGVSMGGGAASSIGLRHPELFDFIAPLGGPASWAMMLDYMETYHLGGFCPVDPDDPTTLTERHCPPPAPRQYLEFAQEFEHWFYPDGWSGQGGTFNRSDYVQIFRDMAYSLGNPAFWNGPEDRYLPPGVDRSFLEQDDATRCANPVVLHDFYHSRFNPDGTFPVITLCDGNEDPEDIGRWDPTRPPTSPLDTALAVDLNGNGRRDEGEPVLSMAHEVYEDVGPDGVASPSEPGYDPLENPDPAGDDYDYLFNPTGTEGNRLYDEGEPYLDYGLDGVAGTPQLDEGGYDYGEGNGRFDWNPTVADRFFGHDGGLLIRAMDEEMLDRIDILADGGVRDLFAFGHITHSLVAALLARGRDVHLYNGFAPLQGGTSEDAFDLNAVSYRDIGQHIMVRYGSLDADEEALIAGDGGHVGTVQQATNRMLSTIYDMSARWPGGDRREVRWSVTDDLAFVIDFTDSRGRTTPVSIILPPGYYDDDQQDLTYPVIYFLHGYGQSADDLVVTGMLLPYYMTDHYLPEHLRMQKLILVIPDGQCRSNPDPEDERYGTDGCIRGTFYVDSWREDGPMSESGIIELIQHIDETYRTRRPEDVIVMD